MLFTDQIVHDLENVVCDGVLDIVDLLCHL